METNNPGTMLDDMGVTCEQLFERMQRTGNYSAQEAMWNAAQDYARRTVIIDSRIPDEFGAEA